VGLGPRVFPRCCTGKGHKGASPWGSLRTSREGGTQLAPGSQGRPRAGYAPPCTWLKVKKKNTRGRASVSVVDDAQQQRASLGGSIRRGVRSALDRGFSRAGCGQMPECPKKNTSTPRHTALRGASSGCARPKTLSMWWLARARCPRAAGIRCGDRAPHRCAPCCAGRWGGEASVPARCTLCPSTPSPPQCAPSAARRAPAVHGAKYLRGVGWGVRRARAYAPLPVL